MPRSTTRLPLDKTPAMTACFTISPDVLGSRPITIVPAPVCVPNACAKRVNSAGVNESPITPRTPEMLILRVGIALIRSVETDHTHTGCSGRSKATYIYAHQLIKAHHRKLDLSFQPAVAGVEVLPGRCGSGLRFPLEREEFSCVSGVHRAARGCHRARQHRIFERAQIFASR
jgi:hypothetical protein